LWSARTGKVDFDTPSGPEVDVLRRAPDVDAAKDRFTETITETWASARDAIAPRLTTARDTVSPYLDTAAARVGPAIEDARARLRDEVGPEAKVRATAALAALRGQAKPARRWPLALGCLLLGMAAGIGAAIAARPRATTTMPPPTPFPPDTTGTTTSTEPRARSSAGNASPPTG
jgi:hypothetical protein